MALPAQRPASQPPPRREGFAGQKLIVLPEAVVLRELNAPLLGGLMPVAAGFFPTAERHLVERARPLPEAIAILCVSGRGWVQIGPGKRQPVEADTLVLVPPGTVHAYGAGDPDPWSIHWAHFRGEAVADFFGLFGATRENPAVRLPKGAAERVDFAAIHERLAEDYTFPNLLSAAMRLRLVFSELHRLRTRHDARTNADAIERTIRWMREHLRQRADLASLARKAGLSVAHYSAVFRRKTGYSPVDYFLRMKVQSACQLLDTTTLRIDEIARTIGCEDPFYFSRLFRRIMTQSPRAYRAATKG